jgi:predicted lipoprotein with Yx(FWY)xxD motif
MKGLHFFRVFVLAAGWLLLVTVVAAQPKLTNGVFTDQKGMSLYWSDNDATLGPGKSACEGACTLSFPPFRAKKGAKATGDFSIIKRDDGAGQWAYKGRPLYFWHDDKKPGDKGADEFRRGVYHVAKPY